MAATDGSGAGRFDSNPTQGGDNIAGPPKANSNSAPTDMPAQLGCYLIKKHLGGGGMGAVYLVENTKLQRDDSPGLRSGRRRLGASLSDANNG